MTDYPELRRIAAAPLSMDRPPRARPCLLGRPEDSYAHNYAPVPDRTLSTKVYCTRCALVVRLGDHL